MNSGSSVLGKGRGYRKNARRDFKLRRWQIDIHGGLGTISGLRLVVLQVEFRLFVHVFSTLPGIDDVGHLSRGRK